MNIEKYQELEAILASPKKIVIIPHRNPDGDAMGSCLGMYHLLTKLNHQAIVISPNAFPNFLEWMPGTADVKVYETDKENCTSLLKDADLIFTLDFNALHRVGELEEVLKDLQQPFVMIDHHLKPDDYAKFMFSNTNYGSTCEMVYHFLTELDFSHLIDKTIATCLYTGILTDSGSFRFPRTTGDTHRIIAEFIDLGVENTEIPKLLFDNSSFSRLQLLGKALQNMKVFPEYNTSYMALSDEDLKQNGYVKGDTEGFVNYGLSIKNICFTAAFIENKDEGIIKISFRSQGNFDVNVFAREHFNGGGHCNAAGGKSELSLEETIVKFENLIQNLDIKP